MELVFHRWFDSKACTVRPSVSVDSASMDSTILHLVESEDVEPANGEGQQHYFGFDIPTWTWNQFPADTKGLLYS